MRSAKGRKHRQWRERKHHFGEMVQMDGSHHDWFEGRGPKCVLMGYIDDATGTVYGRFYDYEGTMPAMDSFKRYIKRYGMPQSVYLDKHTTYKSPAKQSIEDELEDIKPMSQFERSLSELEVTVIHANSPQAKGRIERQFRTLQDRLVKEMRLVGVKSVDQANEFLIIYLPKHNTKFKVKAVLEVDLHRPALSMRELNKIFCIREERTLQNDFTIAYNSKLYQIKDAVKTKKVTVEERMDGSLHITHRGLDLIYREIKTRPAKENPKKPVVIQEKQGRYQSPRPSLEETQKSIGTTSRCFLKSGHFHFGKNANNRTFSLCLDTLAVGLLTTPCVRHIFFKIYTPQDSSPGEGPLFR